MSDTQTQETPQEATQVFGEDVFDELVKGTKYDYEALAAVEAQEGIETAEGIAESISGTDSTPAVAGEKPGLKLKKAKGADMAMVKAFELRAGSAEIVVRPATRKEGEIVKKNEAFERGELPPSPASKENPVSGDAPPDAVEKILHDAQRRMLAELDEEIPATLKVKYKADVWWIRILAFDEQLAIGMEVSREIKRKPKAVKQGGEEASANGDEANAQKGGTLNLEDDGVWTAVAAAMLHVCCVCGESDLTPVFQSYTDARRLVEKRGKGGLALALFNGIITANPDLLKNLIAG